jgi:hypothetical protein
MSELPPEIDASRPHSARVCDYLIGGTSGVGWSGSNADADSKPAWLQATGCGNMGRGGGGLPWRSMGDAVR